MLPEQTINSKLLKAIINISLGILIALYTSACSHKGKNETDPVSHSDVWITRPVEKDTSVYKEFQGITKFMQHMQIRARSTGIISKSFVSVSKRIEVNQPLFVVKSREAVLINSTSGNNNILSKMADTVFAFSSGIIDRVLVQPGDFIQEGDLLATYVNKQSMSIVVSVPLETDVSHFQNKACTILLPDGKTLRGTIGESLPVANNNDQTNQFLVYPESVDGLSENIHVDVRVKKLDIKNGIFVPESSIYANEELTKHWVLKVIHDSIAVKVPVTPGVEIDTLVQVTNNPLQLTDHIIFKGGYALSDSALVNIIQSEANEER